MDSDIYLSDERDLRSRLVSDAKRHFENAPENTEIILLTWKAVYLRDLGAQSLIVRFYSPKLETSF